MRRQRVRQDLCRIQPAPRGPTPPVDRVVAGDEAGGVAHKVPVQGVEALVVELAAAVDLEVRGGGGGRAHRVWRDELGVQRLGEGRGHEFSQSVTKLISSLRQRLNSVGERRDIRAAGTVSSCWPKCLPPPPLLTSTPRTLPRPSIRTCTPSWLCSADWSACRQAARGVHVTCQGGDRGASGKQSEHGHRAGRGWHEACGVPGRRQSQLGVGITQEGTCNHIVGWPSGWGALMALARRLAGLQCRGGCSATTCAE